MGQKPVSYEEGQMVAMKIVAHSYIECSAKSRVRLVAMLLVFIHLNIDFVLSLDAYLLVRTTFGKSSRPQRGLE